MAPHPLTTEGKYDYAITVGVFDLLHEGHVALFAFMRDRARVISAIVHDDVSTFRNKGRYPVQAWGHRIDNVNDFVDGYGVVGESDPSEAIRNHVADIRKESPGARICYVRGDDWPDFPGRQAVVDLGIDIILKPYMKGVSSTKRRGDLTGPEL